MLLTEQGCARLRKAAHWPNNNANPSGLSEKTFIVYKSAICAILREKTPFLAFPEAKKVLLTEQGCARLRTGLIIMQIPRGYQKNTFIV